MGVQRLADVAMQSVSTHGLELRNRVIRHSPKPLHPALHRNVARWRMSHLLTYLQAAFDAQYEGYNTQINRQMCAIPLRTLCTLDATVSIRQYRAYVSLATHM